MWFLGLGCLLLLLKLAAIGPVAQWAWWWVLLPFGLAAAWWVWADTTGYTRRKAMEREEKRRDERRHRAKRALDAQYMKRRR